MFIVPVDTPGVNIVRDVPNMEHPYPHFGMLGGHTEILYEDVRLPPGGAARQRGRGLPDRAAPARAGPDPPLHALARVARRAFDMLCERSLYREVRGGLLRDKQTVQNWIADSAARDAGRAADDAARGVEDRPVRLERGADATCR